MITPSSPTLFKPLHMALTRILDLVVEEYDMVSVVRQAVLYRPVVDYFPLTARLIIIPYLIFHMYERFTDDYVNNVAHTYCTRSPASGITPT